MKAETLIGAAIMSTLVLLNFPLMARRDRAREDVLERDRSGIEQPEGRSTDWWLNRFAWSIPAILRYQRYIPVEPNRHLRPANVHRRPSNEAEQQKELRYVTVQGIVIAIMVGVVGWILTGNLLVGVAVAAGLGIPIVLAVLYMMYTTRNGK